MEPDRDSAPLVDGNRLGGPGLPDPAGDDVDACACVREFAPSRGFFRSPAETTYDRKERTLNNPVA